jgi:hypothetical protein
MKPAGRGTAMVGGDLDEAFRWLCCKGKSGDFLVLCATSFGTPVDGGSLMALNYRRQGQASKAVMTLVIAIAVTGMAILVS